MAILDDIAAAHAELEQNEEGALSLATRKLLWLALAELADLATSYARRVALDRACVEKVLPFWQVRFAGDEGVRRMLDLADRLVAGTVSASEAERARDHFDVDVVDNRRYGSDFAAMFVGHAAAGTVIEALLPDIATALPEEDDDEDLDPESYDPSYMCASAAAGNLNGRKADVAERRAFWAWYLDEAIPAVYGLTR